LSVDWKREVMMDGESGDEGNDELVLSEMREIGTDYQQVGEDFQRLRHKYLDISLTSIGLMCLLTSIYLNG